MLEDLFANNTTKEVSNRSNQLTHTARLTQVSMDIARTITKAATEAEDTEKFRKMVAESQKEHHVMDELITELYDLNSVDIGFLKELDEDTLDRMIKSQQSKRSRAKSKEMTFDNYMTMLTGAVAENLLRIAANKPKTAGGGGARRTEITYSEEELEQLANDPEALGRAIRNVQSKKSIEKRKADFSEDSERWQQLLEAEAQLKAIRDGKSLEAEKALEKANKVTEMLESIDPKDLKAADAKQLLEGIKEMMATK